MMPKCALLATVIAMLLTGCSDPVVDSSTIQTAAPSTTSSTTPESTTTVAEQPQAFRGAALEPGDYATTAFEPTVQFRLEQQYPLIAFQSQVDAGLQNRTNTFSNQAMGIGRYKGVAVHNWWLGLTADQIVAEVGEIGSIVWGAPRESEFGGFHAIVIEGTTSVHAVLWQNRNNPASQENLWNIEREQRLRLIILDTAAGSVLITIQADTEEWDEFLPIAEEILAGISFPELESG